MEGREEPKSLSSVCSIQSHKKNGHGQLYVAFSRATVAGNVKVVMPGGNVNDGEEERKLTRNVVYEEVL